MRKNDSEASVRTTALAESAGDCLSAGNCMKRNIYHIVRRELSRSRLESARGRSRKRSVFFVQEMYPGNGNQKRNENNS